jgi:hypothetical protein
MIIPLKTAGYSSSPTTSAHDSPGMGGSLSVSRPPCDTGSPRVTSFSRPTFSTYTQQQQQHQEDQPSPTSPSTPYSPTAFSGNRPRAFSTASVTMPEYSAQTHSLCIDDFEILDEIGQGAYGLVKLAVQKKDMSQVNQRRRGKAHACKRKMIDRPRTLLFCLIWGDVLYFFFSHPLFLAFLEKGGDQICYQVSYFGGLLDKRSEIGNGTCRNPYFAHTPQNSS